MIINFIEIIKYLNSRLNVINITEKTKIYEVVEKLNDIFSYNFIRIFKKK